jgi:hypothetical protein
MGNDRKYNNRADMFALGCIIFRVIMGQMPFRSDWEIHKYANEMKPIFPERWPPADPGTQLYNIGLLMSSLLAINPIQRPGASETERRLHRIGDGMDYVDIQVGPDSVVDPFFNVDDGECSADVSSTAEPMVQPALRFATRVSNPSTGDAELPFDSNGQVPARMNAADPAVRPAFQQIPGRPQNGMAGMQNHAQIMAQPNAFALQNPAIFLKQYNVQVPPNSSHQDLQRIANIVLQLITESQNKSVTAYKQNLAAQQQFAANANRPPTEAELPALEGNAKQLGGQLQHPQGGGSHSVADYQNQMMVLEQQCNKRLQQETTNSRDGPGPGPQFAPSPGGGLQLGGTPLAGTSMSPSNSRTGPSPRISNMDLQGQQRKPGQKTGSGAASPGQIRGPSPPSGAMSRDLAQAQLGGQPYPHAGLMAPNGQQLEYRQPILGMPSFPQGQQMPVKMMTRMRQGQFPQNWLPRQAFNNSSPAIPSTTGHTPQQAALQAQQTPVHQLAAKQARAQ